MKNTGEFDGNILSERETAAKLRFFLACESARERPRSGGIGTLREKTLHAAVKDYIEPDRENHEVPLLGCVADVLNERGIFEVQTAGFDKLREKLTCFLENTDRVITVVYPIPHKKHVIWLDPDTGEAGQPHTSPKTGCFLDAYTELYKLCDLILQPRLRIMLLLIDMDEYRLLNGWSRDRKRGSVRFERIPTALAAETVLAQPTDHTALLPAELEAEFTAKQLASLVKRTPHTVGAALRVLVKLGSVTVAGKSGRAYVYKKTQSL